MKTQPNTATPIGIFVAGQVRRRRTARKMTQAELAASAGITVETVARLERVLRGRASANANPGLETLERIASSLGCHPADLLDGRGAKRTGDPIIAMLRAAKPATRKRIAYVIEALLKDEKQSRN